MQFSGCHVDLGDALGFRVSLRLQYGRALKAEGVGVRSSRPDLKNKTLSYHKLPIQVLAQPVALERKPQQCGLGFLVALGLLRSNCLEQRQKQG